MPTLDITCQPPAKPARPLVPLEPLVARQDRARVLTLQQDILCHLVVNRVRLHAVLVTIRHLPGKLPVMLLMQATMFLAQPKRARLLVLLERLVVRQVRACVLTLRQDILCHLLVRRVRLHAVKVTIKHHLVKHPAMQLMLATMFRAQPKAARLLVLLEGLVVRLVRNRALMRCQVILYQFRVCLLYTSPSPRD